MRTAITRYRALLSAIVVLGAGLRAATFDTALPYSYYWDEWAPVEQSAHQIAHHTVVPQWHQYPSFLASASSVTALGMRLLGIGDVSRSAADTSSSPYAERLSPELLVAGRLVVLACSIGTILLVAAIGRRLGGRRVALVAAGLAAVAPALVQRGAIVITDTPAAFFATAALYGTVRAMEPSPRLAWRWCALAGAAAGLAFTSKWLPGMVGIAFVVAVAQRFDRPWRERAAGVVVAAAAAGVATLASMPALVLAPRAVLRDLRELSGFYDDQQATASYLQQLRWDSELGLFFALTALVGLVLLLRRPSTRPVVAGYLVFAVLLLAWLDRSTYQHFRNLSSLVPFACVGAAVAVKALADLVAGALARTDRPRLAPVATAVVVLVFGIALTAPMVRADLDRIDRIGATVDTRVRARDWLQDHAHAGDRILVAEELSLLPSEIDAIPGHVVVKPQREPVDVRGYDYVVKSILGEDPWAWAIEVKGRPLVATYGNRFASCEQDSGVPRCPRNPAPRAFHANRVLVEIYGPAPTTRP